jgi:hypothetical protein
MSSQCEGKTKSGSRCKNKTRNESKRCHLHLHYDVAVPTSINASVSKKSGKEENLSEQSSDKSKKSDCCVCFEEMPSSDNLDCGHSVCRACVGQLRNDTCPMCRGEIKAKHIHSNDKMKMKSRFQEDRIARHTLATQQFLQTHVPIFIVYIHH